MAELAVLGGRRFGRRVGLRKHQNKEVELNNSDIVRTTTRRWIKCRYGMVRYVIKRERKIREPT